ncbi:glycerate kinase family protein [Kurthia gibsonii]|uniref:glycerate kinase family protein n=1 Tax=Kurthia gibsonii TaxID=33946 RepID=UPI002DBD78C4|nr:glycerate kinase [Kurthia gibsonii]MEB7772529.1 glycerate kinase [Kurthia gibsonii]
MSHYLVVPDSFKGTLSSQEVANLIEQEIIKQNPQHEVKRMIMSDGGEGFLEAMTSEEERFHHTVMNPIAEPIEVMYGIKDGKMIIEMAQCAGLMLLSATQLNPKITTTYGVGQLIHLAIEKGLSEIVIGIGGSATNDGGTGMLAALGAKFYNAQGEKLEIPKLHDIDTVDTRQMHIPTELHVTIASDVTNPLCGEQGATYIFSEQKGLSKEDFEEYDAYMNHVGRLYESKTKKSVMNEQGAGAAGGIGAALLAFFNTTMVSGAELVLKEQQFEQHLQQADWVITGEGKTDCQTLEGKAPFQIAYQTKLKNKKTMLISGKVENKDMLAIYFDEIHEIITKEITMEEALNRPQKSLQKCLQQISFQ